MANQGGKKEALTDTEKEVQWLERRRGSLIIALIIIVLDILALALGTIMDAVPEAFAIGCVAVITFIGVLILTNYLSRDPELAKKELRKAIAAAFILVYLLLLGLVVFNGSFAGNTTLAETIVGHFTWVVGIIIIFYFGSRSVEEYLKTKKTNGEK